MDHQEVFSELLHYFREGYTLYGASLFSIWAVPFKDREKVHLGVKNAYLGSVPLSADSLGEGYHLYCKIQDPHTPDTSYLSEAFNLYRNLASKAGGHLPHQLRRQIPYEPAGPMPWWLSFMWHLGCPPSEEDLLPPDDANKVYRLISCDPFLESATAIEAFGLHLPGNIEIMKGNLTGSSGDDVLVTVKQISEMVHLEEKSMGPHKNKWPKPSVPRSGTRPAKYNWKEIRPVLVRNFPDITIPDQP